MIVTTNDSGNIRQQLAYDEYGLLTSQQPPASITGEQFRYTGRRYDSETELYYYRARYYSPELGRFLQTDPIGYKDDVNLYAYVKNDPLNKTDPTGTQEFYGDIALEASLRGPEAAVDLSQSLAGGMAAGAAAGTAVMVTRSPRTVVALLKALFKSEVKAKGPNREQMSQRMENLKKEQRALEKALKEDRTQLENGRNQAARVQNEGREPNPHGLGKEINEQLPRDIAAKETRLQEINKEADGLKRQLEELRK